MLTKDWLHIYYSAVSSISGEKKWVGLDNEKNKAADYSIQKQLDSLIVALGPVYINRSYFTIGCYAVLLISLFIRTG